MLSVTEGITLFPEAIQRKEINDFQSVIGNKNLFDESNTTTGAYINAEGEYVSSQNGKYTTDIIPISSISRFTIIYKAIGVDVRFRVVGYDSNGDFVRVIEQFDTGSSIYTAEKMLGAKSDIAGIRVSYSVNAELIAIVDGVSAKKWLSNRRYSDMKPLGTQPSADGSSGSFCNTLTGTYADLLTTVYEPLRTAHPNYISRVSLGKDASNTYDIYAYTFEPRYYQQSILLVAGIHANEEDAIACLARFAQMITNNPDNNSDFNFIRQNVKVTIVPVVNVWGFSQSPHNRKNADDAEIQQFTTTPYIAEDAALVSLMQGLKDELSFVVDMHTTTNDTYRDFYGVINKFCPNVRTLFKVNSWLCDNYALNGRDVDDQYFGYRTSTHTFNAYCWNTVKVPSATLELSDYHWGQKGSSDAITMGVTMWTNYIVQQINDCYSAVDAIPFEDYREVQG